MPEVEELCRRFVKDTGYTGQLSLDIIISRTGDRVMTLNPLECNPRATSGIHLLPPIAIGRLFDSLVDREKAELETRRIVRPRHGIEGKCGIALLVMGPLQVRSFGKLYEYLLAVWYAEDASLTWRKPQAILYQVFLLLTLAVEAWWRNMEMMDVGTADILWNAEHHHRYLIDGPSSEELKGQ